MIIPFAILSIGAVLGVFFRLHILMVAALVILLCYLLGGGFTGERPFVDCNLCVAQ